MIVVRDEVYECGVVSQRRGIFMGGDEFQGHSPYINPQVTGRRKTHTKKWALTSALRKKETTPKRPEKLFSLCHHAEFAAPE